MPSVKQSGGGPFEPHHPARYRDAMGDTVSVRREIAAPPDVVWALVSDLPRMGEWSDENDGGRWLGETASAVPGAKFKGDNRNGRHTWSTTVTVVDAVPGELFRFDVKYVVIPIARWTYELEPTGTGTSVRQTWDDHRPGWFKPIGKIATGVDDRAEQARASMTHTLEQLAATAEQPAD